MRYLFLLINMIIPLVQREKLIFIRKVCYIGPFLSLFLIIKEIYSYRSERQPNIIQPGYWTNSCCGHPRVGEALEAAAHRRLGEEMGFDCPLKKVSSFIYHAILPNNLIEYEYHHVFIGRFDKEPIINLDEVSDYKWVNLLKLRALINNAPDVYTVWFKKIINGLSYQDIEEWQRLI